MFNFEYMVIYNYFLKSKLISKQLINFKAKNIILKIILQLLGIPIIRIFLKASPFN